MEENYEQKIKVLVTMVQQLLVVVVLLVIGIIAMPFIVYYANLPSPPKVVMSETGVGNAPRKEAKNYWSPADIQTISDGKQKELVLYGQDLIAHTAKYLGPNGTVQQSSNGMNCQNCHLQAGTAIFGNNYGSVASLYPKFRARSGSIENIYKRVNDCFERSLNGKALDTTTREMQAIVAYINFLGSNVEKGKKAEGSGFKELTFLQRAAEVAKGKIVYEAKCQSCHQKNGEGVLAADQKEYTYPPLWGKNSYNDGAGLYRLSNFARYVKYNMPQGVTFEHPQLTDEEAWDIAAFVNSQKRPHIAVPADWPDKAKKPVDHPFGPYADSFSPQQHKYGPFQPIVDAQKQGAPTKK